MRELELVKQQLVKQKLDAASAVKEKMRAEEEADASGSKMRSSLSSLGALRKELEEVSEEQVLLELARIEAVKEMEDIEAQREKEACQFRLAMEMITERKRVATQELESAKDLEIPLASTKAEIGMVQDEVKLVREMMEKEIEDSNLRPLIERGSDLVAAMEEVELGKRHLATLREEGMQCMASIDMMRVEMDQILQEAVRSQNASDKKDLVVQKINSKILRAHAKLDSATSVEEKVESLVSSLAHSLRQLQIEAEAAKNERDIVTMESAAIREGMLEAESLIKSDEERLQAVMQELEAARSSEAAALEKLKTLAESTMRRMASAVNRSSLITISNFEYEYLMGGAAGAEEVADKKAAAARSWVEALKASEKEMVMKIEMSERELEILQMKEEKEVQSRVNRPQLKCRRKSEIKSRQGRDSRSQQIVRLASPRKSMKDSGGSTPGRRAYPRKSSSPASNLYSFKKRRMIIPNLAKAFITKRRHNSGHCFEE